MHRTITRGGVSIVEETSIIEHGRAHALSARRSRSAADSRIIVRTLSRTPSYCFTQARILCIRVLYSRVNPCYRYTEAMELAKPSVAYKDSFLTGISEDPTKLYGADVDGFSFSQMHSNFAPFVEGLNKRSLGVGLPEGYVPDTILWLVDGGEYIGQISIRHQLNDHLKNVGGHIGYIIRPSMRRRGYGTEILKLSLPEARKLGLKKVLLTCDETNIGSRKIIEKNGGGLEDKRPNPAGGPDKLRFWIELV